MRWGQDPRKWLIINQQGRWRVYPPVGSFWATSGAFARFEEARLHYREQVEHHEN